MARVLGSFRVEAQDSALDCTPPSRKSRAFLAYMLLVPGQTATRDRLAGLLWSDKPEAQAKASLRQCLADLRKTERLGIDSFLVAGREEISISPGHISTDVALLEYAAVSGDLETLRTAIKSWTDDLMTDLSSLDESFDEWLYGERARRAETLLKVVTDAVGLGLDQDAVDPAREIVRHLLTLDPANELVTRLAIKADYLAQDIASLHRHYKQLTEHLQREFGVTPSSETRKLFADLTALRAPQELPHHPELVVPATPVTLDPPAIILSPLTGLSGPDSVAVARGLTDDLRTALARFPDLRILSVDDWDAPRVAAATSSAVAAYRGSGSVRQMQGRLRVSFQLVHLNDGLQIWADQMDGDSSDIFGVVDKVVAKIVGAVAPAVERHVSKDFADIGDKHDQAYALYLAGRRLSWEARTADDARRGAAYLEQAIELEPKLAVAYQPLALLYNTDFRFSIAGHDYSDLRDKGLALSQTAVSLDRNNPLAHITLGWSYLRKQQWARALDSFDDAMMLGPHNADCANMAGYGMILLGELDRADMLLNYAFELNPFPRLEYFADIATLKFFQRDFGEAEEGFALCPDEAYYYDALRIANLAWMDRLELAQVLAEKLRTRVRAIWAGTKPPTDSDCTFWMLQTLQIQVDDQKQFFLSGLRNAGFEI